MGILDNEPCRYCGQEGNTHRKSCELGLALMISFVSGAKEERKIISERVWQYVRNLRDSHDLDLATHELISKIMGWVQEEIV